MRKDLVGNTIDRLNFITLQINTIRHRALNREKTFLTGMELMRMRNAIKRAEKELQGLRIELTQYHIDTEEERVASKVTK